MKATTLVLTRTLKTPDGTLFGVLSVHDFCLCHTVEHTEVPPGNYPVVMAHSERWRRLMPLLLSPVGLPGINIHPEPTPEFLGPSIAVGTARFGARVTNSKEAFSVLFLRLGGWLRTGDVYIEVRGAEER